MKVFLDEFFLIWMKVYPTEISEFELAEVEWPPLRTPPVNASPRGRGEGRGPGGGRGSGGGGGGGSGERRAKLAKVDLAKFAPPCPPLPTRAMPGRCPGSEGPIQECAPAFSGQCQCCAYAHLLGFSSPQLNITRPGGRCSAGRSKGGSCPHLAKPHLARISVSKC